MERYRIPALVIFILAFFGMALAIVNCTIGIASLVPKNRTKANNDIDASTTLANRRQDEDIEMGVTKPNAAYRVNEMTWEELGVAAK